MQSLLLLLSCLLAGFVAATWLPPKLRLEDRVLAAIPLGLALGAMLGFIVATVTDSLDATTLTVTQILLVAGAVGGAWPKAWQRRVAAGWRDLRQRAGSWRWWAYHGVFAVFAALMLVVFSSIFFEQNGNLYAGWVNIWGDWNQHLSQTTSFAYGHNLPPELSVASGQKLTYPFLTNFFSAMLLTGGWGIVAAMTLPVTLLAVSGVGLLMSLTRLLAGALAAALAPLLFYFGGGLGFVNFFRDLEKSHQSLGYFLAHLPHTYTQTNAEGWISNLNWINMVYAYLGPQRAFTFGLSLLLVVLICLHQAITTRDRWAFLTAGLVAALLPLIHTHSLLLLLLLTPPLFWLTRRHLAGRGSVTLRKLSPWAYFLAPVGVVAIPQLMWLTSGVDAGKFLRPQFGWVKYQDGFIWFWLKNFGIFLPLFVAGLFYRKPNGLLKPFAAGAVFVFVVINLWVFQPWDWDNTKFLVYAFLLAVPLVAAVLARMLRGGIALRVAVVLILLVSSLSGIIDVSRTVRPEHYKAEMFNASDRELAEVVRRSSAPDAVFLTTHYPNNPIAGLAGRKIVLGYTGWLWSYGLEFRSRKVDAAAMYAGSPDGQRLLAQYGVNYVVIGPRERDNPDYQVDEDFFQQNYPVWMQVGETVIYEIKPTAAPSAS